MTQPLIRPHMPELDSVRGIAVLLVLLLHGFHSVGIPDTISPSARRVLELTQFGGHGVDLFFVLSGFLITGILLGQRDRLGYYQSFYLRRALRILPPLFTLLILLAIFRIASAKAIFTSLFFLSNIAPLFGLSNAWAPLWSLAVEEHFYLIWPTVIHRLSSRFTMIVAGAIVGISPLLREVHFHFVGTENLGSYTWLVADGLAFGAALAVLLRSTFCSRKRAWLLMTTFMGLAIAMLILGSPYGILSKNRPLGAALQPTITNLLSSAILLLFLLVGSGRLSSVVNIPPLRFFGYISYGLYLYHGLWFVAYQRILPAPSTLFAALLRFVICATAAVLMSWQSRRYLEEYFLIKKTSTLSELGANVKTRKLDTDPLRSPEAAALPACDKR